MRADLYWSDELGVLAIVTEAPTHVLVEAADEVLQRPGKRVVTESVAAGPRRAANAAVRLVPSAAPAFDGDGRQAVGILDSGAGTVSATDVVVFVVVIVEKLAPFVAVEGGERRVVAQLRHVTVFSFVVSLHQLQTVAAAAAAAADSNCKTERHFCCVRFAEPTAPRRPTGACARCVLCRCS